MNFNISLKPSTAQSLKITWKIPEYFSLPETPYFTLDSPSFIFMNATWCLRIYPNRRNITLVSVVRLHSLVSDNEIICNFNIVLGNGEFYTNDDFYPKFVYDENREGFMDPSGIPERSTLAADQKKFAPDGTLKVVCHLLSEETSDYGEIYQTCAPSYKIYEGTDVQKNASNISLKFSKAHSFKIIWTIPEYFSLPDTSDYSLSSPTFDFGFATWFLKLYPNGTKDNWDSIISLIRLQSLVQSSCHEIFYSFDIIVENEKYYQNDYNKYVFSEDIELEDSFPKRSILLEDRNHIAPDGDVTYWCHLFFEESAENDAVVRNMLHELHGYRTLCKDFKNLFLNGRDHDLTLKVKEKEFRVHRNILSVRSQVFESMLSHDMAEKNSGVVDISDCDPQAMEQFLLHVYCGKVDSLNDTNMLGLYYAADKYSMMHLKEECRDFIQKSLSPRNICNVVQLALNHCDEKLLECATEYFVNNITEILTTGEWMSFMRGNETVANELFIKASRKLTDENKMLKMEKLSL